MKTNNNTKMFSTIFAIVCIVFIFQVNIAHALTPIARVDVVPYQRIEYGTTFNFGVVAFSKEGIDRVEFTITGQGYDGGIKTATEMTLNTQVASLETTGHNGVWEYWVPIASNEFTNNGPIVVTAIAYGEDLGTKNIGDTTLIVEALNPEVQVTSWVDSVNGNNTTGEVGNINQPYLTIAAAVSAAQIANGGSSSGNIIYLKNGTYSLSGVTANATTEWLTISGAPGTTKENVILNSGGINSLVELLKISNLTVQGSGDRVINRYYPPNPEWGGDFIGSLWDDNTRQIGNGRWSSLNNEAAPIAFNSETRYSTNNYLYDSGRGYEQAALVRGTKIERIGNDAFSNTAFIVNCEAKNLDPGPSGVHLDAYQAHTTYVPPANNRIIYGYRATDVHISGIFLRSDAGLAENNAFVNVMVEMREPSVPNESGIHSFVDFGMGAAVGWNHFLMWNCSFPYGSSYLFQEMTNGSIVGNVFWQLIGSSESGGNTADAFDPNNVGDNTALYNHFMWVRNITPTDSCPQTSADIGNNQPCPHWFSQIHDSSPFLTTATTGGGVVDISNPDDVNFGTPVAESILIDRIPFATVPTDIYGNPRIGNSDIGSVEYISSEDLIPPSNPSGLSVL